MPINLFDSQISSFVAGLISGKHPSFLARNDLFREGLAYFAIGLGTLVILSFVITRLLKRILR